MLALITPLAQATTSTEEESSNFLVSPNVGLMIWTLLSFLVAFFVLRKWAWPAITEALDKRQRAIEESIDVAERTRADAQKILDEYRERLREARAQADEIVSRARKAGEVHEREALEKAKIQREELLEQTRRDVLNRIAELQDTLAVLDRKISFYADADRARAYEAEKVR